MFRRFACAKVFSARFAKTESQFFAIRFNVPFPVFLHDRPRPSFSPEEPRIKTHMISTGTQNRPLPPTLNFSYPLMSGGHADYSPPAPLTNDAPEPENDRPRALVVDDAPDVTEMIATLMRYAGYEVEMAYSATQALDAARRESFDVIISDIGMPGMNGYELAEALRSFPAYTEVPMIAVTGFTMYTDRERALHSGFNDFLTKPINPVDLIELVKRLRG